MENLLKPLEWEEGIMRAFCEGCDATLEANRKMAKYTLQSPMPSSPILWKNLISKVEGAGCVIYVTMFNP